MEEILQKLERIRRLWAELKTTSLDSPQYTALVREIQALSKEYTALVDAATKP